VAVTVIAERDGLESIQGHVILVQFPDLVRVIEDGDDTDERGTETGESRRTED
jgi:hypothetical protein